MKQRTFKDGSLLPAAGIELSSQNERFKEQHIAEQKVQAILLNRSKKVHSHYKPDIGLIPAL